MSRPGRAGDFRSLSDDDLRKRAWRLWPPGTSGSTKLDLRSPLQAEIVRRGLVPGAPKNPEPPEGWEPKRRSA